VLSFSSGSFVIVESISLVLPRLLATEKDRRGRCGSGSGLAMLRQRDTPTRSTRRRPPDGGLAETPRA
jgi:hypothetical protein